MHTSILCMHNTFNLLKYYGLRCIPCTFSIHLSVYCNCSHLDSDITHRSIQFPSTSFSFSFTDFSHKWYYTNITSIKTTTYDNKLHQNNYRPKKKLKKTVMPRPYIYNLSNCPSCSLVRLRPFISTMSKHTPFIFRLRNQAIIASSIMSWSTPWCQPAAWAK